MTKHSKGSKESGLLDSEKLFYLFAGFLILVLPLIHFKAALDTVLFPRLLAVTIFLALFTLVFFVLKSKILIDFSIFRHPVFLLLALYLLVVIASAVFASNPTEGYFDIVRTFVFLLLVFYWVQIILNTPAWFELLSKLVIISTSIALAIGYYQYFGQVAGSPAKALADGRELLYAVDGLMAHKNLFSDYLMLMLPFLIGGSWKLRGSWRLATRRRKDSRLQT